MDVLLGLGALVGALASAYWGVRLMELSTQQNGGLAALFVLGPLGLSMIFTAVCLAGAGIINQLKRITRDLKAERADQRKVSDSRRIEPQL